MKFSSPSGFQLENETGKITNIIKISNLSNVIDFPIWKEVAQKIF